MRSPRRWSVVRWFGRWFCGALLSAGEDEHTPTGKIDPGLATRGLQIHAVVAHGVDAAVDRCLGAEDLVRHLTVVGPESQLADAKGKRCGFDVGWQVDRQLRPGQV